MTNPWGCDHLAPERAVLLALSAKAQDAAAIARAAGIDETTAIAAIARLDAQHLVIHEDGAYELTGPLCWFGSFERALVYNAVKRIIVRRAEDDLTHLYVCDIRKKGAVPAGDPRTETASVLGCGIVASNVVAADGACEAACDDCACVLTMLA